VDVKLLKQQLSDATGELALKNESLSSLEKRIGAQNRDVEELISAKVRVDALEKENSVLRQQAESIKSVQNAVDVKLLKQQLSDATGELALKNESLSSLEKRIEAQNRDIDSLESCISKHQETQNALEKEVALSAVHSSMLFRELKEARSKLVLTSEEALKFQQQHSDLLKKVDGTSGSIQALWKEREFDLEV
jgi:chromosome segregation ATPase